MNNKINTPIKNIKETKNEEPLLNVNPTASKKYNQPSKLNPQVKPILTAIEDIKNKIKEEGEIRLQPQTSEKNLHKLKQFISETNKEKTTLSKNANKSNDKIIKRQKNITSFKSQNLFGKDKNLKNSEKTPINYKKIQPNKNINKEEIQRNSQNKKENSSEIENKKRIKPTLLTDLSEDHLDIKRKFNDDLLNNNLINTEPKEK